MNACSDRGMDIHRHPIPPAKDRAGIARFPLISRKAGRGATPGCKQGYLHFWCK